MHTARKGHALPPPPSPELAYIGLTKTSSLIELILLCVTSLQNTYKDCSDVTSLPHLHPRPTCDPTYPFPTPRYTLFKLLILATTTLLIDLIPQSNCVLNLENEQKL